MSKTVRAHTNIALIKYWGKADAQAKIPVNSSISFTLDQFYTDTRVVYDATLQADTFTLNGAAASDKVLKRVQNYMNVLRTLVAIPSFAHIESTNHVPLEAGLASSASAFAALAKAATLHLDLDPITLSKLARLGSGSASRSFYPGFVRWEKGCDHESSYATPIAMEPWPEFVMIVCMVSEAQKPFTSTQAMHDTAIHSPYYEAWAASSEADGHRLTKALQNHDIWEVGTIAQTNAMKMHASLLGANLWYFEPKTVEIMNCVRSLQTTIPAFFTMDAGPNVKIMTTQEHVDAVVAALPHDLKTIVCKSGPGVRVL